MTQSDAPRSRQLKDALAHRILVLDGAMGTAIQKRDLTAKDFGGEELEGCNEFLVITRPDVIREIHREYLDAGCDIVETNTFGGTPLVLAEYALEDRAHEINLKAAKLAREEADRATARTPDQPRFVAGSIGPTTKALSVTGGTTFEELRKNFLAQARALQEGGVDYFLIETCQDTRNIKAALLALDDLALESGTRLPVAVSGTIEPMGTMLAGQTVDALYAALANRDLLYIGLNCATGPEFMTDHIRTLSQLSHFRVACVPNAGLPDHTGCYLESPEMVSNVLGSFIERGWLNVIGGCCGTHAGHIAHLARLARGKKPRTPQTQPRSFLSNIDYLEITDELRPVLVGERTNVIGSKKFKELIVAEKFEEASEIARAQAKAGAQIIDVCLANPDRDELQDMERFLSEVIKKTKAPLMIDSTDEKVIALALPYSQGKAIINSVNLEDGEERFETVTPLARQFGAALVVGTIDEDPEQGMGVTRARKLEIAERSFQLLTEKYGIPAQDIYWDPLVFPCATGDAQYVGSAVETIEALRLLKQRFPLCKTVLGISNVSFGLPAAGREVLNSVFLYHCVQAGLDLAIVNSEKLERYAHISEEERTLSENLLWNRGDDPIAAFAAHFRTKTTQPKAPKATLPLDQRLSRYILEGSKDGLTQDLDEALQTLPPLEIINGPLMRGMDEVGKLFNENKLIVAEVLQSAEAMKAAVAHLEPKMEKNESSTRGKVLLATVKGDVHDIGKNLVEIILSNNGFRVVNLGIKVPPEKLIEAVKEHKPDIVGLSGLLVKSAQQMVITAEDLSKAGVAPPMLVGGAALSSTFVDRQIAPAYTGTVAYAGDAMHGLDLAKTIVDPERRKKLEEELHTRRSQLKPADLGPAQAIQAQPARRSTQVPRLADLPQPPDFERHILTNTPIEQIWRFINPLMMYGRHLGIKGAIVRLLERAENDSNAREEVARRDPKALKIWEEVRTLKQELARSPLMQPRAVFRFFKARSEGNTIHILDPKCELEFPRQKQTDGLCLADYLNPDQDNLAMFVTSVGRGVREQAEEWKNSGQYLRSHILQVLALESAEAYAEFLHAQMRKMWGFADPPEVTMMERFQAKYRGKRYSFGYPACPRLDDQAVLWNLLEPQSIGVELTEGFMMDPEASVSAVVFHHPSATYFSVGHTGGAGNDQRTS